MQINEITDYSSFLGELRKAGFSIGGENDEGVFSLCSYFGSNIEWHVENPEIDPWEWRMRVLNECDDIAYSKLFFNKSGYITKQWYPYFYAVRRGGVTAQDLYESGQMSHYGLRIYDIIRRETTVPLNIIKSEGGFTKEDKSKFDRAITELQMKMFITMCGSARKRSGRGEEYGWSATVFCTSEWFFGEDFLGDAAKLTAEQGAAAIEEQVRLLNPGYNPKKLMKFIKG